MKGGFWLRGGNGKLAGTTVYQSNGETIVREVVSPSNPQTQQQMIQRIIMHTVGAAYSLLKEICDHSFEGIKKGRDTMAYFMKQNLQFCRDSVSTQVAEGAALSDIFSFSRLGRREVFMNQYQISMGSLPSVNVTIGLGSNAYAKVPAVSANTYKSVIESLGLKRGDQLTFLAVDHAGGSSAAGGDRREFTFCRVILDPTNPDGSQASLESAFIADNKINLPSVRNEGEMEFGFDNGVNFRTMEDRILDGVTVIVSRKVNDEWLRSTQYMVYNMDLGFSLGDCLADAQGTTQIYTPNEQYLNNAGEGNGSSAAAVAAITGVSVDGTSITAGTPKTVDEGEHSVLVLMSNAEGATVKIKDGTTVAAQGTIGANGQATIALTAAENKTYVIYYNTGDEDVVTTYTIECEGTPPPSGGGGFGG